MPFGEKGFFVSIPDHSPSYLLAITLPLVLEVHAKALRMQSIPERDNKICWIEPPSKI
jgi:hypothetical protein